MDPWCVAGLWGEGFFAVKKTDVDWAWWLGQDQVTQRYAVAEVADNANGAPASPEQVDLSVAPSLPHPATKAQEGPTILEA